MPNDSSAKDSHAFLGAWLVASSPPAEAREWIASLDAHAHASSDVQALRHHLHDDLWPAVFVRLKQEGKPKSSVLEGLTRAVAAALKQRSGSDSLVTERDRLRAEIRRIDALRSKSAEAAAETRSATVLTVCKVAASAFAGATAALKADLARIEGIVAMSSPRHRGVKHQDNDLVAAVDDVLVFHGIAPKERAQFIRRNLPSCWRWYMDQHGTPAKALTALADSLGARSRSPRK